MNRRIIADSSALVSLASVTDSNHELALSISRTIADEGWSILLPSDVFTETINTLGKKITHAIAAQTARLLLDSDAFPIIEVTAAIRERAFQKYLAQADSVSFTDCLVMALADHYDSSWIFGFDEHFSKNGYTLLLPEHSSTK